MERHLDDPRTDKQASDCQHPNRRFGQGGGRRWPPLLAGGACAGLVVLLLPLFGGSRLTASLSPQQAWSTLGLSTSVEEAVWAASSRGLMKLAPADAAILLDIADADQARAIALDEGRGTVWAYWHDTLRAYGFDGSLRAVGSVPSPRPEDKASLAAVASDGSVWLGGKKRLDRFTPQAQLIGSVAFAEEIRALTIDRPRPTLWVGTKQTLTALDPTSGAVSLSLALGHDADLDALAVVPSSGDLWVALEHTVRRYSPSGQLLLEVGIEDLVALASDAQGGVWGATEESLVRLGPTGQPVLQVSLPHELGATVALGANLADDSVWVAGKKALTHLGGAGQTLLFKEFDDPERHLRAMALPADIVSPTIEITAPAAAAFLNTSAPTITVAFSDVGAGVNEGTLAFKANATALEVDCTTTDSGATCTPRSNLADGVVTLTVTVQDWAGNLSDQGSVTFTIDTVAPTITVTSPPDGLLTNQSQQLFGGSVSEPATVTLNGQPVPLGADNTFAVGPVTLHEGLNAFTFEATDRAGNTASPLAITVTLDTVPPAAVAAAKVTASQPSGGQVTVTGTPGAAEPLSTVILTNPRTGDSASVGAAADGGFQASIVAQGGDTLHLAARDAAGNLGPAIQLSVGQALPPDPATVAPPLDPTVATNLNDATQFLYTGSNPIQTGVAAGTIEPRRVAVVRGRVSTRDGLPLPGVTISIWNHPELGQTLSRLDGVFDLAVNGGGVLTVNYAKEGYLAAQRQVDPQWQDYASLPEVVLIGQDAQVTAIDLAQPAMQVARGSAVTDGDGTRQATVLFPAGTTAALVLPDGTQQPLTTLHVRATEVTVGATGPKAMPAELPANVAYTYCVDFAADEAVAAGVRLVTFSQPVIHYIENFLQFPVGVSVPLGAWDPDKAAWIPADSGKVVKVLSITGGLADLDIDGSGTPASGAALAALGVTDAERGQLASLYPVNASLWRMPISHFSAWDANWSWAFSPGADATSPDGDANSDAPPDDSCRTSGSIIEIQNQFLGEAVPVASRGISLNYSSARMPGYRGSRLRIRLTGAQVPASLKRVELEVSIAGRTYSLSFPPNPNQLYVFDWDRLDTYGRPVRGAQPALIRIGYVYDGVYQQTTRFGYNGGGMITGSRTRQEVTLWQAIGVPALGVFEQATAQVGGWSLNVHHALDVSGRTLYLGDGRRVSAFGSAPVLATAVYDAAIGNPQGVAIAPDGTIYIPDWAFNKVWKVAATGQVSSLPWSFHSPHSVDVGADGSLYIAVPWEHRIWRVNPDGTRTAFAGNGSSSGCGQEGVATAVSVCSPLAVDAAPDGEVYIAEGGDYRIRKVAPDGRITNVAGTGQAGYSGDGGPAAQAQMSSTYDVQVAPDGSVYIADLGNNRVRRVGPDGIITTVAGTGQAGYSGDGGPATLAALNWPTGLAFDRSGALIISEAINGVLRRVDQHGVITTIAGPGLAGAPVENVPATQGSLMSPRVVRLGPDGNLYVAAWGGSRVRVVKPGLRGFDTQQVLVASQDGQEAYEFAANGRHLRTLNALTGTTLYAFAYDAQGLLTSVTDADGAVTSIERDGSGNPAAIVSPDGQRTTLSLDANGYLASITNAAGEATAFTYTPDGLLLSRTDPRGNTSTLSYDALGRLTRDEDAAGGFIALARSESANHLAVTTTTAEGRSTTYTIDKLPDGRESRTVAGCACSQSETLKGTDGSTTVTSRDGTVSYTLHTGDPRFGMLAPIVKASRVTLPSGLASVTSATRSVTLANPLDLMTLTSQIDSVVANGKTTTTVYSAATKRITTTSPQGRQAITTLDAKGRPLSEQVGGLTPVAYGYDARGRLSTVTQGTRTSTLAYDAQGNLASIIDPAGRTTGFATDLAGRVTAQILPDGRQIGFGYDPAGNVTSITPPGKPAHAFAYTPVNLQGSYTPPDVGIGPVATAYAYNLDKQLTTITRPDGQQVGFGYDATGKLSAITSPLGQTSLAYDAVKGQLSTVTTPDGQQLASTYDGFLETGVSWSGAVNGSVTRSTNSDFRVTSTSVNGTNPVNYSYDNDGLVTQAGALSITRSATTGLITGTTLGSVTDSRTYNSFGEITGTTANSGGSPVYSVSYTRDVLGRISQKQETIGGVTDIYTYSDDTAGRLTQVVKTPQGGGALTTTYAYDSNGNRLSKTEPNGTVTAGTYDDQDRLLAYGDITYSYTANGDLTSKTQNAATITYDSDVFGNLRHVVLDSGIAIDYVIDGRNRRTAKRINGTLVQGFLYDNQLRIAAELDGSGNVVSRFVYGTHVNVPEVIIKGTTTYRIVTDHLGSPRLVINTTDGSTAQRMDFDEFGVVTLDTNPGFQPFGFAGGLYDLQTKLVRFGFRDYDARVGRWTTKDPILFDGGQGNLYTYVLGDPINGIDPPGLILVNNYHCPILIKPEGGGPLKWVAPSSSYGGDIDGAKPPNWRGDWYKVPDDTDMEIDECGNPHKTGGLGRFVPEVGDKRGDTPTWRDTFPGRKSEPDWGERHPDWAMPPLTPKPLCRPAPPSPPCR